MTFVPTKKYNKILNMRITKKSEQNAKVGKVYTKKNKTISYSTKTNKTKS